MVGGDTNHNSTRVGIHMVGLEAAKLMEYDPYKPHKLKPTLTSPSVAYIRQGVGMPNSEWPELREVIRQAAERWWEEKTKAATRPTHTDLMVPPEELHEYIERNTMQNE